MPELPEVETVRKALEKKIANKKIIDFHIGNKKLRFDLPEKFKQLIIGQIVMKPLRVGKFCLLPLCSGKKHINPPWYVRQNKDNYIQKKT